VNEVFVQAGGVEEEAAQNWVNLSTQSSQDYKRIGKFSSNFDKLSQVSELVAHNLS
jgi:hypothetical protein